MLLGWGAQEALRVRAGRLARSSLDVDASGLVRSKESIPAIRFVRVVLLSTISVLYRVCQTNNSTLDCSVTLRSECSHVVWARIEPVPGSSERCERRNNGIERSNQDRQRCGRAIPATSKRWSTVKVGISGGLEEIAGVSEWGEGVDDDATAVKQTIALNAVLPGQTRRTLPSPLTSRHPSSCYGPPSFLPILVAITVSTLHSIHGDDWVVVSSGSPSVQSSVTCPVLRNPTRQQFEIHSRRVHVAKQRVSSKKNWHLQPPLAAVLRGSHGLLTGFLCSAKPI